MHLPDKGVRNDMNANIETNLIAEAVLKGVLTADEADNPNDINIRTLVQKLVAIRRREEEESEKPEIEEEDNHDRSSDF